MVFSEVVSLPVNDRIIILSKKELLKSIVGHYESGGLHNSGLQNSKLVGIQTEIEKVFEKN